MGHAWDSWPGRLPGCRGVLLQLAFASILEARGLRGRVSFDLPSVNC